MIKYLMTVLNSCNYRSFRKNSLKTQKFIKCGCIVFNESLDEIILVLNNYSFNNNLNKWGLPKGFRENNETYADCAMRELYEECGLKVKIINNMPKIKINNTYYFILKVKKNLNNHRLFPIDKKEIKYAKWIKIVNLKKINLNRETEIFRSRNFNIIKNILHD